jgi:ubiquitin-conjugating enzyme E2 D/E
MFRVNMVNENLYHWEALLYGPEDSLYQGYQFKLEIKLPNDYPFSAPNIKFITPIQHVNINNSGDICLDIIKDSNKWTPSLNIITIILSIMLLLSNPNFNDPFNSKLAELYRTNYDKYVHKIKHSCEKYAQKKTMK